MCVTKLLLKFWDTPFCSVSVVKHAQEKVHVCVCVIFFVAHTACIFVFVSERIKRIRM